MRDTVTLDIGIAVALWKDPQTDSWVWTIDGRSGSARTRDRALFYAGWWHGRRVLAKHIADEFG